MKAALCVALLVWSGCLLTGCKTNAVNLSLSVFPDGSGKVTMSRLRVPEKKFGDDVTRGLVTQEAFTLDVMTGSFRSLDELAIGEIRGSLTKEGELHRVSFTIKTTAGAKWFKSLGLDRARARAVALMGKRFRVQEGRAEATEGVTLETLSNFDLEHPAFLFELRMPGPIQGLRTIGEPLPKGWLLKFEPDGNEAYLAIPLEDIHAGATDAITIEVISRGVADDARDEWEKNKRWIKTHGRGR